MSREGFRVSWLDDYANTASKYVDAPTQFQKVAAYWTLGAALGKRVFFQFGMVPVYPNLYTVFVGKSGFIKKSITKNFALDVLGAALPELDLPGRGSPEAFRDSLEEKGWYGVLHYDEFYEYLTKGRKDYTADLDTTLMELFAHGRKTPIRTKTSGEIVIPPHAIISFVAPTTLDLLLRGIRKDDLMSGKMARFMMLAADQDIEYPVPPPMPPTTHGFLAVRLKAMVPSSAGVQQSAQMVETPAARKTLEDYYYAIRGRVASASSPLFGGSFSRAQMYAIKLAMIHAIANGRMTIEPGDYDAIQPIITNWAECLDEVVRKVDVESPFHEMLLKAEDFLKRHPQTTQRDLQRFMRLRKFEMSDLLEHLKIAGIVEMGLSTDIGASRIAYKGAAVVAADPATPAPAAPAQDDALAREIEMAENPGPDPSVGSAVSRPGK
jgi:hypothetical protein